MIYIIKLRKKARQGIDVQSEIENNISDFETNFKPTAKFISSSNLVGNVNSLSWSDFKTTVLSWAAVNYTETETAYILYYEINDEILFKSNDGTVWCTTVDNNGEFVKTEL